MPDFSAKMHQIRFPDPTGESSSWLGGGWLPPLQEHTPALGPSGLETAFFRDPTILAPKPKSQTSYVPKDATLSSPELVPPLFRPTLRPC